MFQDAIRENNYLVNSIEINIRLHARIYSSVQLYFECM